VIRCLAEGHDNLPDDARLFIEMVADGNTGIQKRITVRRLLMRTLSFLPELWMSLIEFARELVRTNNSPALELF
jgi:hypothetical protein